MNESETTGANNKEFFEKKFKPIYQEHLKKYQEEIERAEIKSEWKLPDLAPLKSDSVIREKLRELDHKYELLKLAHEVSSAFQGGNQRENQIKEEIENKRIEIGEALNKKQKAVQEVEKQMREILETEAKKDAILSKLNTELKNDARINKNLIFVRVSGVIESGPLSFEERKIDLVLSGDKIDLKENLSCLEAQPKLDIPTLAQTLYKDRSSISVFALPLENSFSRCSTQDEADYRKAFEEYCDEALRERSVFCIPDKDKSEESQSNRQTQNEIHDDPKPSTSREGQSGILEDDPLVNANRFAGSLLFRASNNPVHEQEEEKKDKKKNNYRIEASKVP
jgi:hypothetical protein